MSTTKEVYIPQTISRKQQLFLRYFTAVLVDLTVLNFFADAIIFSGAYHGVVAFIVVVFAILIIEYLITRLYESLA